MDMADDTEDEIREPPRRMSAMGFEIEPELEAPLLGTLGPPKSQSRLAPILVLLGMCVYMLLIAALWRGHR